MTYESQIQPAIRLDSFHLSNLFFNVDSSLWGKYNLEDVQFKMNHSILINDDKPNYFGILFKVIIQNSNETIKLDFDFIGNFEVKDIVLTAENVDSNPLLKNSAPAIIFPYVRSFVSNFTLNAGFNPIILPAINFHTAIKQDVEKK